MRIGLVVLFGLGCLSVATSQLQAALSITSQSVSATGNAYDGAAFSGFYVSENLNNQTVVASNGASLGKQGSLGDYSYNYSYGTSSITNGNDVTLSVLTSINTTAHSNQATDASSGEIVTGFINFSLTSTYQGTLNFTSILDVGSSDNNLVNVSGALFKTGTGYLSEFYRSADTSGNVVDNSGDYPAQFILGPGDYQLSFMTTSSRNGVYDVNNAGSAGTGSISLSAVPEPASIALWSCIVAGGLPKLRRYIKRRKAAV